MNIKEKMYEKKNLNHVIHATFNPNGPGSIRLHLVPTKFSFFKSVPNIVVLNGRDYIPLNTAWSILLSIFIEEISKYQGLEIPDDTLKLIVNVTVERMRDIYGKKVGREDIKDDLWEMIDTFTAIAKNENVDLDFGDLSISSFYKELTAPHRVDLMISSMEKDGKWNCNQQCIHCYAAGQKLANQKELSTEEFKKILHILQDTYLIY